MGHKPGLPIRWISTSYDEQYKAYTYCAFVDDVDGNDGFRNRITVGHSTDLLEVNGKGTARVDDFVAELLAIDGSRSLEDDVDILTPSC